MHNQIYETMQHMLAVRNRGERVVNQQCLWSVVELCILIKNENVINSVGFVF